MDTNKFNKTLNSAVNHVRRWLGIKDGEPMASYPKHVLLWPTVTTVGLAVLVALICLWGVLNCVANGSWKAALILIGSAATMPLYAPFVFLPVFAAAAAYLLPVKFAEGKACKTQVMVLLYVPVVLFAIPITLVIVTTAFAAGVGVWWAGPVAFVIAIIGFFFMVGLWGLALFLSLQQPKPAVIQYVVAAPPTTPPPQP